MNLKVYFDTDRP